jgi:putative PEP-CTERM system TPR-repeat lipoprotein
LVTKSYRRPVLDWLGKHYTITGITLFALVVAITAAIIIVMGTVSKYLDNPPPSEAEYLKLGTEEFAANRLPAAVTALIHALEQNPRNDTARLLLARSYLGMNDGAAAEREINQLSNRSASYSTYVTYLAQALLQQGKYQPLLDQFHPEPELPVQTQAELMALRGQVYLYQGDLTAAQQELDAAMEVAPEETLVQLSYVRLRLAQQRSQEAAAMLQKILADAPEEAEAWSLEGELAFREGDLRAAEQAYSKAIQYRYSHTDDLINRALLHIQLGDYKTAKEDIAVARERLHEQAGVLFAEGFMSFYQANYAEAWSRLGRAQELDPNYLPTYFYLGLTDYALHQWQLAEKNLTHYLQAFPHTVQVALLLAGGQLLQGNFAAAEATLQGFLARNPKEAEVLEWLGYIYLAQDKLQAGVEQLRLAAERRPNGALLHGRLGLAQWALGQNDQAIRQFEQAATLQPGQEQVEALWILNRVQTGKYSDAQRLVEDWRAQREGSLIPEVLQGVIYRKLGKTSEAQAAFEHALRLQPGNLAATLNGVELALVSNQPAQAQALLRAALQAQPANPVLLAELAALEYQSGHAPEARQHLTAALNLKPDALPVRLRLANLWLEAHQPREAVRVLQQVSVDPTDQPALQELLGRAQLAAGDWFDATQTLRNLAWSQPSAQTYYLLAAAYDGQGESNAAQREVDKALAIDPNYWPAQLARARQLVAAKQLTEAQAVLEKVRRALPNNSNVIDLEGDLAMAGGDYRQALASFSQLHQQEPAANRWVVKLAQAQESAGQPEAAVATYRQWLAGHPDDSQVQGELANAYLKLGRAAEAETIYARLLEQQLQQPDLLINLAWLLRQHNPTKAQAYAEQALKLKPDSTVFKGTLALILLEQGKAERAAALLKETLGDLSQGLSTQFRLVQALAQTGEQQVARRYLRRILEDPRIFPERLQAEALLNTLARGQ